MATKSNQRSESVAERGGEIFDKYKERVPEKYKKYANTIRPVVMAVLTVIDLVLPHLPKLWDLCKKGYTFLLPVWDEVSLVWGFILTFFGSSFIFTITAVEAFRLVGKDPMVKAWLKIEDDVKAVIELYGNEKEKQKGLSAEEWMKRNGSMVLATVNPDDCRAAMIGFYAGVTAILACLRNHFAQVVALGASVGEVIEQHIGKQFVSPIIKALLPEEHWRWTPLLVQFACRLPAVIIAWTLQRIISAFHSAMRGGNILSAAIFAFAHKRGLINEEPSHTVSSWSAVALGFIGLMFQLSTVVEGLPFFLSIPLLPFTLIEYFLSFITIV